MGANAILKQQHLEFSQYAHSFDELLDGKLKRIDEVTKTLDLNGCRCVICDKTPRTQKPGEWSYKDGDVILQTSKNNANGNPRRKFDFLNHETTYKALKFILKIEFNFFNGGNNG